MLLNALIAAAVASASPISSVPLHREPKASHVIVHDIYIKLKDAEPADIEKQLEIGRKYLTGHKGEISFTSSTLARGLARHQQVSYLVNDTDFDVAFHLRFKSVADHNAYQTSESHVNGFIRLSNPNWTKIRVFDSEAD